MKNSDVFFILGGILLVFSLTLHASTVVTVGLALAGAGCFAVPCLRRVRV